ncbi:MAG: amidohydrolase family protein [Pseudomonadota bacterium]|nr:amidohydrolase family protein [Pseudomonadota bacterium]
MEQALDADGHVHEEEEMFTKYLEPEYRSYTEGWQLNGDKNRRFIVKGTEHPPFPIEISVRKPMAAENRIKVLNKEKIRLAVLYPSAALTAGYMEPSFAAAIMRAYNNWMSDWCSEAPDRLKFAAPVVLFDVNEAIKEAQRAVSELGAVAVTVRPNPSQGKRLDHPERLPFYAAIEELGVPLVVHESTGDPSTAGGERYGGMDHPDSYLYHHMFSHPFEQMLAMMSLICSGILERHPQLKVGFFEAGCSWAPYWIARLDEHYEHPKLGHYMDKAKLLPSEYFERQCVVSCDPGDPTIPIAIQALGAHKVLFATDYPHFDSGGGAVQSFLDVPNIEPTDQWKVLHDNAAEFYGL